MVYSEISKERWWNIDREKYAENWDRIFNKKKVRRDSLINKTKQMEEEQNVEETQDEECSCGECEECAAEESAE